MTFVQTKEKKSNKQCELDENMKREKIEIICRMKDNAYLVGLTNVTYKNKNVQKNVDYLERKATI